jgi:hypothetical protein
MTIIIVINEEVQGVAGYQAKSLEAKSLES